MLKYMDEPLIRFLENLKRPKRKKSEQSNQKTSSSQEHDRQIALDTLKEKRRQWLEYQEHKKH